MAKGNIFMGTLKGRVGESVFYVSRGEQNQVKYQRNISNPQSSPQVYQRSRFLAANKFYTRGRQQFFKFAFENKRKGESDFNAFMRENIKNAPNITRDAFELSNYPIIGQFTVSKGSLPTMAVGVRNSGWRIYLDVPYKSFEQDTIGALSSHMLQSSVYEVGDIITLLFIQSNTTSGVPEVVPSTSGNVYGAPVWKIIQFKVDPSDTTDIVDLGIWYTDDGLGNMILIGDEDTEWFPEYQYSAFTCVHSRNVRGKLKVSTQTLTVSEPSFQAIEDQRDEDYIKQVIANWKTPSTVPVQSDAILKGSLVTSTTPRMGIYVQSDPSSIFSLSGNLFTASRPVTTGETLVVGYIVNDESDSPLQEAACTAIMQSGDEDVNWQFDKISDHKISISVENPTTRTMMMIYRIAYTLGGQPIPLATVKFQAQGSEEPAITQYISSFSRISSNIRGITEGAIPPQTGHYNPDLGTGEIELFEIKPATGHTFVISDLSFDTTNANVNIRFSSEYGGAAGIYISASSAVSRGIEINMYYKTLLFATLTY